MTDKHYLLHDAQLDLLRGLNELTDRCDPDMFKVHKLCESIMLLEKTMHMCADREAAAEAAESDERMHMDHSKMKA